MAGKEQGATTLHLRASEIGIFLREPPYAEPGESGILWEKWKEMATEKERCRSELLSD